MVNILYIHDYDASGNSLTALQIKNLVKDYARLVAPDFPKDPQAAIKKAVLLINTYMIDLIIGNSYGGFIALNIPKLVPRVVINPVLKPSEEYLKLFPESEKFIQDFAEIENKLLNKFISTDEKAITLGIFSSYDEHFSHKEIFTNLYGNTEIMSSGHIIKPTHVEKIIVPQILQFIRILQLHKKHGVSDGV